MKITLIQTSLHWENPEKNRSHFDQLISNIKEETDLIVLPEMFTTGFSMKPESIAEPSNGETLRWMKKKAKEKKCTLTGSVSVEENGKFYNRMFWVNSDEKYLTYNKKHLFRMAKEEEHYTPGEKKVIAEINGWKICLLICYDLRFPVWSRNKFNPIAIGSNKNSWDYDILLYVANWPQIRNHAWKQLLIARAIENQCFVVGLNRVGKDGNGFDYSGDSMVINPKGESISKTKANEERIETVFLDKKYLEEFRINFPVGLDADKFDLYE